MGEFRSTIAVLGINPYVSLPAVHLKALFRAAGRSSGPLPILVTINGVAFKQTLVKYQGEWRLYLNARMRQVAGKEAGQRLVLGVDFDPAPRVEPMPPELELAFAEDGAALAAFQALAPSRKKEILRYLNQAKTRTTLHRNVGKVIAFLLGRETPGLAALGRAPQSGRGKRGAPR
jgi:bacteriocin resistance YdeI/OmpD-like protein/uncharacterized protein DUF1905